MEGNVAEVAIHEPIHTISPDTSVSNLSVEEVTKLLEQCSDRKEKFSLLASLYARKPEIKKILNEEYGYTPEKFSSLLTASAEELLAKLPEEYNLVPRFRDLGKQIYINIDVLSPEAEKEYYEVFDRTQSYDEYVRQVAQNTTDSGAAYIGFTLRRQNVDGILFDSTYANHVQVYSKDVTSKPDYGITSISNKNKVATPLLRKEGGTFSVSDAFIAMEEKLVGAIARESNSFGISSSSLLSKDGMRLHERNDYTKDYMPLIPEPYKNAFEKTNLYNFLKGESDSVLKVINIPTSK